MTTTIQEMQQHIAELENDNQELANAIEETDKLNSERIAELEDRNTALTESENYAMAKASRLDAALGELEEIILRGCPEAMPSYAVIVGKARAGND